MVELVELGELGELVERGWSWWSGGAGGAGCPGSDAQRRAMPAAVGEPRGAGSSRSSDGRRRAELVVA